MVKMTFSVDEETVRTLKATAERLHKPQSLVVREAVAEYASRAGQLTAGEQRRMLRLIDGLVKSPATRPQHEADAEIAAVRQARRQGGRRRSPA